MWSSGVLVCVWFSKIRDTSTTFTASMAFTDDAVVVRVEYVNRSAMQCAHWHIASPTNIHENIRIFRICSHLLILLSFDCIHHKQCVCVCVGHFENPLRRTNRMKRTHRTTGVTPTSYVQVKFSVLHTESHSGRRIHTKITRIRSEVICGHEILSFTWWSCVFCAFRGNFWWNLLQHANNSNWI